MSSFLESIEIDRLRIEGQGVREEDAQALALYLRPLLERALQDLDPASLASGSRAHIETLPLEWPAGAGASALAPQLAGRIAAAVRQGG